MGRAVAAGDTPPPSPPPPSLLRCTLRAVSLFRAARIAARAGRRGEARRREGGGSRRARAVWGGGDTGSGWERERRDRLQRLDLIRPDRERVPRHSLPAWGRGDPVSPPYR
jgi:hypothetical protein